MLPNQEYDRIQQSRKNIVLNFERNNLKDYTILVEAAQNTGDPTITANADELSASYAKLFQAAHATNRLAEHLSQKILAHHENQ